VVTYECGGMRQKSWSKRNWDNEHEREYLRQLDREKKAERERRIAAGLPGKEKIRLTPKEAAAQAEAVGGKIVFTPAEAAKREREVLGKYRNSLDIPRERGIMREEPYKMSARIQEPPDFSKYEVIEDIESVEKVRQTIIADLEVGPSDVNLEGIKNSRALDPFIRQMKIIKEETGISIPAIKAVEIIEGDECCIAGFKRFENTLYISSRYFNSPEAITDTLSKWASDGIMPKNARTLRYIAEHECAHIRIPEELMTTDEAIKIWKGRKLLNDNDSLIHEYYADVVAIFRTSRNIQDKNIINAVEYLRRGGVKI
jgi:hypothetical protein